MEKRNFTLVALTTFGRKPPDLRIIKLGMGRIENGSVKEPLVSLINPEQRIPGYIAHLTGVDDATLQNCPNFGELAERVYSFLQDAVLVAHNCSFVYYALQSEFRYLGFNYTGQRLCTMRLAKKLIPDLSSYELPDLSGILGIPFINECSTEEEVEALSILFQRLLSLDSDGKVVANMLDPKPKITTGVPAHIDPSYIDALPSRPGVYKFQDKDGTVIYVGKAKNIKKRVLSHFYHPSEKERSLCRRTCAIDYEQMGSELLALLRESDLIQKHGPEHNYVQKNEHIIYHIIPQKNREGILQLNIERRPFQHVLTEQFFKRGDALKRVRELCERFQLCPKFSGIERGKANCEHCQFQDDKGVCRGSETIGIYNARVEQALDFQNTDSDDYVIFEKGRHCGERSFVLILQGVYQGYGFLDTTQTISGVQDLLDVLEPKKHSYHTAQIVSSYAKKNWGKLKRTSIHRH